MPRCPSAWRALALVLGAASLLAMHGSAAARRPTMQFTEPGGVRAPDAKREHPVARGQTDALPPAVSAILRRSGLPSTSFALDVRSVDGGDAAPLVAWHADRPFLLASTTKVVTSLAALDLLGPAHRWKTTAYATGPLRGGRIAGDLVIVGGEVGLTANELRRWFAQMHDEGVHAIAGNIVLDDVALLHELDPKQATTTAAERSADAPIDPRTYNVGKLLVTVRAAAGERAAVTIRPSPANVRIVNDVFMGGESCSAWARWKSAEEIGSGPPLQLWVRGRWRADCAADDIAYVAPPAGARLDPELGAARPQAIAAPRLVADLWAERGGALGGRVVVRDTAAPRPRSVPWSSELLTPVGEVLREMNKTSNNEAARSVLLSLASPEGDDGGLRVGALKAAQERMRDWLRTQGLRDGDVTVVLGSGQSRAERGKPRAIVELLRNAWRSAESQTLVASLPIAGVDGTLVHRMTNGAATGQAYLKTGTLSDTRALAGYVRAKSGRVYAVSLIVTDPDAAKGTLALDSLVEWVARSG
ncbi:MAG TPA: D-alanyl-D-alanine carboxypeptidase [Caldimonas sp.]|jgi:D-alanyl-D-alanine carboxypeptidase/D-alanyl-D-alanine-endopeptidase (penicillin-binding protein 4)|nr:D-alanyl-D-alanine carboxypeptidase [Caldimonas sp.]